MTTMPRLAVSCVFRRAGKTLLVRRGREPAKDRWAFPGGSVEPGETMVEAVCREMSEETGLEVGDVRFLLHHEIIERGPDGLSYHYVIAVHTARACSNTEPRAGDDAAEARFVSPDELDGLNVTETTLATFRMLADGS